MTDNQTDYTVTVTLDTCEQDVLTALLDALLDLKAVGSTDPYGYVRARVTLRRPTSVHAVDAVEARVHRASLNADQSAEYHVTSAAHLDEIEPDGERDITVGLACALLGVSRQRVHQMVVGGMIASRRLGRELVLAKRDVAEIAASR